jgi:hypothetical protein
VSRKVSSKTCFIIDKPNTPPQATNRSLFFHIIATSLYTFLPAFWEFKNSPSIKFRSSHPKTLTRCFLNCLLSLKTLSTQLILRKSENMVVGGCQIRAIGGVWKNLPPHLCNCFRCEASGMGASVVMQYHDVFNSYFPLYPTNFYQFRKRGGVRCLYVSGCVVVFTVSRRW